MRRSSKARLLALVLVNLFLIVRVVVLWANRDTNIQVPPLPADRILVSEDANAATCREAVITAIDPDAGRVGDSATVDYDIERIQALSDALLADHLQTTDPDDVIKTEPILATLPLYEGTHHIYGTLWLPPTPDGTYNRSQGAVAYVDAESVTPIFIFTGIQVDDPITGEGCILAQTQSVDWVSRYRTALPFAVGVLVTVIGVGLLLDYRDRVNNFKLHKPG